MIRHSKAREVALQLLYQRVLNPSVPRNFIEAIVTDRLATDTLRGYCVTALVERLVSLASTQ
jgi:hypothetical protein